MAAEPKLIWPILILPFLNGVLSSVGDNSPFYNNCVHNCNVEICEKDFINVFRDFLVFLYVKPIILGRGSIFSNNLFGFGFSLWSCLENCEYDCQWKTVAIFQTKNWAIPQFKGKWPFIRLFGFQEPASVLFSVLNFLAVLKSVIKFRKEVSKSSPYYYVWNTMALVQLNCWVWSTIYHSRDTDFTERMDYISAFIVVLYSVYGVGLRYISSSFNIKTLLWSIFCASLGINHLAYLWLYNYDYGYNMKLNIVLGGICIFLWFLWSFLHFNTRPYVWKIFLFALLVTLTTIFELLDFPPVLWLIDAHALWHGSTIFVNCIFYWFVIDDCNYLSDNSLEAKLSSYKIK